jgi:hypothetical protein
MVTLVSRLRLAGCFATLVLALAYVLSENALAEHINLTTAPYPDIFSDTITINYTPSSSPSNNFVVSGYAESINVAAGTPVDIDDASGNLGGSFNIALSVDESGKVTAGTLDIEGQIGPPLNVSYGSLLHGNIAEFGYPSSSADVPQDQFEFVFTNLTGSLAYLYPEAFVTLSSTANFSGDFTQSYSSSLVATDADTHALPEPGILVLLGSLLPVCVVYSSCRWRRKRLDC